MLNRFPVPLQVAMSLTTDGRLNVVLYGKQN
jgi:hypothetical protein